MKGDFSRVSFAERKHYQEVLLQQGRVQLDADWNEAEAIRATRDQRALQDVVGRCGSPNTGFQIAARMMLDSMESTAHWAGTNADVCVDYVDYLRGTASLRVTGTTQIAKTLADPVDFTNASISFAVKVPLAHPQDADTFTFFVSDLPNAGGNAATVAVGLLTPQKVGPWRVYTIPLTPAVYQKVDLTRIQTIGFKDLVATRIYHFDSIQRDFAPPSVPLKDILALDDLEDLSGWSVPPSSGTGSVSLDGATLFNGHPTVKITGPGDGLRSFAHARDLTLYKRFVVVASTTPTPTFFLQPSSGPRIVRTPASATTAGDWTTYLFEPGADLATITGLATITAYGIENVAAGHAVNVAQVLGVLDLSGNFFILGGDDDYPGRLYVDGIACQKEATETYYSQRDYPEALALGLTAPADDGRVDLVYVDVCQRHVTYIEDPQLREVALAGPDTCTRNQTVAQVKVLRGVSDETTNRLNCAAIPSALATTYAQLAGRGVGTMSTLVSPPTQPTSLCEIAPDADYLGLDNRLYRVEIHDPGVVDTATFKWSKDNGAIAVAVVEDVPAAQATQVLKVERLGRDRATTIAKGDLVEIADDLTDLSDSSYDTDGVPRRRVGELRKVTDVDPDANAITLDGPLSNGYTVARHAKVRRWDGRGNTATFVDTQTTPQLDFGDGVRISFDASTPAAQMLSGDYWQFTARGITGQVEQLDHAPPVGVVHHYCPLALIRWKLVAGRFEIVDIADCRPHLPALTELEGTDVGYDDGCCGLTQDANTLAAWHADVLDGTVSNVQQAIDMLCAREHEYLTLRYVSGDGQEGLPQEQLPAALVVAVENVLGEPQEGVHVDFAVTAGGGTVSAAPDTDANGETRVTWTLGLTTGLNLVRASLTTPQAGTPEVIFNARVLCADKICYDDTTCDLTADYRRLGHAGTVDTVQEAVDTLCEREQKFLTLRYVSGDGQEGLPQERLPADLVVAVENILGEPGPSVHVDFAVTAGGGTVSAAPDTDANGETRVTWTLGATGGLNLVRASLADRVQPGTPEVIFNARVLCADKICYNDATCGLTTDYQRLGHAGAVDTVQEAVDTLCEREQTFLTLRYVSGDGQEGTPRQPLAAQLIVAVENILGEPKSGVRVDFAVTAGGGTVSAAPDTDGNGETRVTWTLGPDAGLNLVKASLHALQPQANPELIFNARGVVAGGQGCCCTITVGDGKESHGQFDGYNGLVQAIRLALEKGGATVCLLRGTFNFEKTIVVPKAQGLVISGNRLETQLRCKGQMAFLFQGCTGIELHDLQVLVTDAAATRPLDGLVVFQECVAVLVEGCTIHVENAGPASATIGCVVIENGKQAPPGSTAPAGAMVRNSHLLGGGSGPVGGVIVRQTSSAQVVGNLIELTMAGGRNGVALEENSADCVVLENTIVGTAPGLSGEPGSLGGIHVGSGCDRAVVRENQIIGGSGPGVGLGSVAANRGSLGGVSGVSIDRNEIREMASNGVGVLSFERPDLTAPAPITDELTVSGNKIEGCAFAAAQPIVVSTGGLAAAQQVKLAGGVALWMGEQIRLLDNDIHDNGRRLEARAPNPVAGVVLYNPGSRLTISRNRILDNVGTAGPLSGGIVVAQSMAVEPTQPVCIIAHNEVAALAGPALSVAATAAGAAITMANNVLRCAEHHDAAISVKAAEAVVQFNQNEVESLTDLSLPAPAAILIDGVHITFSGNHCVWRTPVPGRTHVFLHTPRSTTAIGNHCLEPQPGHLTSLELQGPATGIVVVGNITTSLLSSPAPATTVANITGVTL